MFQRITWIGLSLALHLAVATGLFFSASSSIDQLPKPIMVMLDNSEAADVAVSKVSQALPVKKTVVAAIPVSVREPAKHEVSPYVLQTASQYPTFSRTSELVREKKPSQAIPEIRGATQSLTRSEEIIPAETAVTKKTVSAMNEQTTPEKSEQRYLKENFAYIRDLITKQLVYPPIARRMNWSGKVVVAFVIAEDGTAHSIRVMETSGYPVLDTCVIKMVRSVAPFPRPPVRADILLPVTFKIVR